MKKLLFLTFLLVSVFQGFSQKAGITYQAVILNPNTQEIPGINSENNILANSIVAIRFTIINASSNQEYQEYHNTSTDRYGMINLLIGSGNTTGAANFTDIVWNDTTKLLKVEIDFTGKGTNYNVLSEQNLTYMPQPVTLETQNLISGNTARIAEEEQRAINAEAALTLTIASNNTLENGKIYVGNASNEATQVNITGDVTIDNQGVATIAKANEITANTAKISYTDAADVALNNAKVGITTTQANEITANTAKISYTDAADVALNNDKVGITTTQASEISANTLKTGITTTQATAIDTNATNIAAKANIESPTFTGTPTLPTGTVAVTQTAGNNTTAVATTAYVDGATKAINTLADGKIYLGNGSNKATQVALSGDVTINNAGVSTIGESKVTNTMLSGSIDLTTKVTGVLPIANGGTGSATQNFVDLTTAQTIAGVKTFSNDAKINGITVGRGAGNIETNTSTGLRALASNTTGTYNSALGTNSLQNNSTGSSNVAIGGYALSSNFLGNYNTALGYSADVSVISGEELTNATAIGFNAIVTASNTIQLGNTDVTNVKTSGTLTAGAVTYTSTDGTTGQVLTTNGVGVTSWGTPTTTATSYSGVLPITNGGTGSKIKNFVDLTTNQSIRGVKTYWRNIKLFATSYNNVATMNIGFAPNGENLNGISFGIDALKTYQYGVHNIAIGNEALANDLRGSYNIGIGYRSLFDFYERNSSNPAYDNIAIGRLSGANLVTGDNNTFIGSYSGTTEAGADISNSIALGNNAKVTTSNTIQLGNNAITNVKTSGTITAGDVTYTKTDGTSGQVLVTNGSGITAWGSAAPSIIEVADEFTATAAQTAFTLAQTPSVNSKVKMYINGIRISNLAYTLSGTTLTYESANNGSYALSSSDRIQFDYFY